MAMDPGRLAQGHAKKLQIKWTVKDELRPGFGHGLEFWYSRGPKKDEAADMLVAIVEGYRWLHNPLQKWVTVKILPKDSGRLRSSTKSPDAIIRVIKDGVRRFFDTRPKGTEVSDEVRVWWTG